MIGKMSCRGDFACFVFEGPAVGDNACVGVDACMLAGSVGDVGRGACRGHRACFNNPGPISKGTCNGPPNPQTGRGVCEIPHPDYPPR
jgi:hypothetical protein